MTHKVLPALAALVVIFGAAPVAVAQSSPPIAGAAHVSATGKHMPDVGLSKSAGVTALDKKQDRKMEKETTICKGC